MKGNLLIVVGSAVLACAVIMITGVTLKLAHIMLVGAVVMIVCGCWLRF